MTYQVVNGKLIKKVPLPYAELIKGELKIFGSILESFSSEFLVVDGRPTKAPVNADLTTKGDFEGLCNRSACLRPGANWWNVGSRAYYCEGCAAMINMDGCRRFGHPDLCFEGRSKELGIEDE